jgi:hypothetical protein
MRLAPSQVPGARNLDLRTEIGGVALVRCHPHRRENGLDDGMKVIEALARRDAGYWKRLVRNAPCTVSPRP